MRSPACIAAVKTLCSTPRAVRSGCGTSIPGSRLTSPCALAPRRSSCRADSGPRDRIARAMAEAPLLELRGITKGFPGVLANDNVNFDLASGEVHALLGENGAGKSTLMNILYGLYTPDEGQILLRGKPIELGSTRAAIEHGIGMVHQHFMLIPVMTVAENIVLATEPRRAGVLLDYDAARKRVGELSERYGLLVDPDARVDRISVGQQQRVEILKALYRGAEILILDEPTAVLTPQEAKELL